MGRSVKNKELKEAFHPECYRIYLDVSTINMNTFIEELSKISNITFDGTAPVAFLQVGYTKKDLQKMLSKKITSEFFCEKIEPETCVDQNSAISVFFKENYERNFAEYINRAMKETLSKIDDNIQKANARLDERIREAKVSQK